MPYIPQKDRDNLEDFNCISSPGQLNFYITEAIAAYTKNRTVSYQTINDVLGALEGAKMEYYRRIAVPYENQKLTENGDVY